MPAYLARRITRLIFSLFGLSVLLFALTRLTPVDPVRFALGPQATAAQVQAMRHQYGLDRPLPIQYLDYMSHALRGNLGLSLQGQRSVAADIGNYLPNTIELVIGALVVGVLLGVPLGVLAASWPNSLLDSAVQVVSTLGVAVPSFWLAVELQVVFAVDLGWLPLSGIIDHGSMLPRPITHLVPIDALITGDWSGLVNNLYHLILPAVVLAFQPLAMVSAMTRVSMLEVRQQEYVKVARAKGLSRRRVIIRHVLRNSWLPIINIAGLNVGWLLGGSFLVETVFGWSGIGYYGINATLSFDFPAIIGVTLVIGVIFAIVNALTDVLYGLIDPRVRHA